MAARDRGGVDVRLARPNDLEQIVGLLGVLFDQEDEFVASSEAQRRGLVALMDEPTRARVLVAERNGCCVGATTLQVVVSTALGTPVAILEDMVVDNAARGEGVGRLLLSTAIDQAVSLGCRRITLLTDRKNDAAHRFYGRHGFVESAMLPMRLVLDLSPTGDARRR